MDGVLYEAGSAYSSGFNGIRNSLICFSFVFLFDFVCLRSET